MQRSRSKQASTSHVSWRDDDCFKLWVSWSMWSWLAHSLPAMCCALDIRDPFTMRFESLDSLTNNGPSSPNKRFGFDILAFVFPSCYRIARSLLLQWFSSVVLFFLYWVFTNPLFLSFLPLLLSSWFTFSFIRGWYAGVLFYRFILVLILEIDRSPNSANSWPSDSWPNLNFLFWPKPMFHPKQSI